MAELFELENTRKDRVNKVLGLVISLVFHGVFILILALMLIKIPNPPFPEDKGGVEMDVDYGQGNTGFGAVEPAPNDNPSLTAGNTQSAISNGSQSAVTGTRSSSGVSAPITSDDPESPITQAPSNANGNAGSSTNASSSSQSTVRNPNQNAMFKGSGSGNGPSGNNPRGTGFSQGIAGGNGNQGDPNGGTSNVYQGTGRGDGDFSLANRSCVKKSKPSVSCDDQGTIMIKIRVDKAGKVISASYTPQGSSSSSSCLIKAAESDAMKWQFNDDDGAADMQNGTIKYVFKNR